MFGVFKIGRVFLEKIQFMCLGQVKSVQPILDIIFGFSPVNFRIVFGSSNADVYYCSTRVLILKFSACWRYPLGFSFRGRFGWPFLPQWEAHWQQRRHIGRVKGRPATPEMPNWNGRLLLRSFVRYLQSNLRGEANFPASSLWRTRRGFALSRVGCLLLHTFKSDNYQCP